jgi:hypothetical protein
MIRNFVLAIIALNVLVSCVSNEPYRPVTKPEKVEFGRDRLDVYPDDIRKAPAAYAGAPVVWAGIIRSTEASDGDTDNTIVADTVFEQHYFDWVQDDNSGRVILSLSPRGEGLFRTRWHLDKLSPETTVESAEKYAAPGKLAIVYGAPEKVAANGTVVLKYRYLRIVDADHFRTNEYDYGRLGEPFCVIQHDGKTNAPPR